MGGSGGADGDRALWSLGAAELAASIRAGDASSEEVIVALLERIDTVNPKVNAITRVMDEEALAAARRADRARARGEPMGPLHGVPVSIKENVDVVGSPTTHGVPALAEALPARDAAHVELLRRAGAFVLSRTNLPDFASRWDTDSALHGLTVNPWRAEVTAGGSSGGEAVAVATGMSPLGFGNDDGGSLRFPAQCVGICSLKPTLGRVPDLVPGRSISDQLLNVQGPMARRIADLRLALDVVGRFDDRDPWSTPPLDAPADAPKPRVAMLGLEGIASQVADGIEAAADLLRQAGYEVVEADPPHLAEAAALASRISLKDLRTTGDEVLAMMSEDARTHLDLMGDLVGPVSDREYQQCYADRLAIAEEWAEFQRRCPVILAPVSTRAPFTHGADLNRAGFDEIIGSVAPLLAVNALGLPAAVVPVGTGDGLPQVAQLIGPRHRDELCLDVAEAIEALAGPLSPIDPLDTI